MQEKIADRKKQAPAMVGEIKELFFERTKDASTDEQMYEN